MSITIRDDDISYFTTVQQLDRYKWLWAQTPIHLAVVPYIYTRQGETPKAKSANYWIGDNRRLVAYLRKLVKERKVVIWQHGFTHRDYGALHELERRDRATIARELAEGKSHLEKTFGVTVDTLVAPHDRFSKQAILAAQDAGFTAVSRCYAPLPREIQWTGPRYLVSYARLVLFWLRHGTTLRYPKALCFGKHRESFSYRIEEITFENKRRLFARGDFCVTMHHRTTTQHQLRLLAGIVKDHRR